MSWIINQFYELTLVLLFGWDSCVGTLIIESRDSEKWISQDHCFLGMSRIVTLKFYLILEG